MNRTKMHSSSSGPRLVFSTFRLLRNQRKRLFSSVSDSNSSSSGSAWSTISNDLLCKNETNWREVIANDLTSRGLEAVRDSSYGVGEKIFSQALAVLREEKSPKNVQESLTASNVLHCQGLLANYYGRYKQADECLNEALKLLTETPNFGMGDDQFVDKGGILIDLSNNSMRKGEVKQAENFLRRCQYMVNRAYAKNANLVALTEISLAELSFLKGDVDDAIRSGKNALEAFDAAEAAAVEGSPQIIDFSGVNVRSQAMLLLAKYLMKSGYLGEARIKLEESEKLQGSASESSIPNEMAYCAKLYTYYGILYALEEDFESSKRYFAQANNSVVNSVGLNVPDAAITLHNNAVFADDLKEAIDMYTKAEVLFRQHDDPKLAEIAHFNLESINGWAKYIDDCTISFHQRQLKDCETVGEMIILNPSLKINQLYIPGGVSGATVRMINQPRDYSFVGQQP
mmetsp:Transcript_11850/g.13732  ORF Transcript_11850/g.13732 Transcript_11850/m.13732 type:complete len:457 (-) Transcript_11850:46-1416(-)